MVDPRRVIISCETLLLLKVMTKRKIVTGTVHRMPADFRKAIESDPIAKDLWADITPLARTETNVGNYN